MPEGRLSEDVDLIAVGSRAETAAAIEKTLRSALRRSHGRIAWAPALTAIRDTDAAVLVADDGQFSVRIQLLDRLGYELWPTSMQAIEQRYRDAPAASLRVPTAAAFAAWKTVAWHDRGALRVGNAGLTPLETWIGGAVVHELRREALSDDALGEIAGPVTGAKTANRQILGFMNEMAIHADCAIVDAEGLGVTPTYSTASCGACSTTATVGTPRRLTWSPSGARAVGMTHRATTSEVELCEQRMKQCVV